MLRLDAERGGGRRRADRDVGEPLGVGLGVDRAVAVDQHPVGQRHEEHRRDDRHARRGLDDLEGGPDRVLGGVGGPGDHAVGEPPVDHHGPEVAHVQHRLQGELHRDALVGAQLGYSAAKSSTRSDSAGSMTDVAEVDAERRRPGADLLLVTEQGQVDDVAAQQHLGGAQDAFVLALGQHDVLAVGAGPLQQSYSNISGVTRSVRATSMRSSSTCGVDVLLEHAERGLDLALVAGPHDRRARGDPAGPWSRCRRHRQDRDLHVAESVEERSRLGEREAAGEHQRGDVGEGAGGRPAGPGDDVGPVARRDQQRALVDVVEHVRQAHRGDLDAVTSRSRSATEPASWSASSASTISRTVGMAASGPRAGPRPAPRPLAATARPRRPRRLDPVDHDRGDGAALGHQRLAGDVAARRRTSSGSRSAPLTTASTGAPRWLAIWALTSNSSAAAAPV
jgi:hypothetical protein